MQFITFGFLKICVLFKEIFLNVFRGIGEPKYMPILSWEGLNKILTDALRNYNELNAAMDLVT
jgi:dynein heavy chain